MRVLVACECSGVVRDAFARKGHDAWSCDLKETERPGQHVQGDVRVIIDDFIGWDLIIAHPPCTYLSYAGVAHWTKPGRKELREQGFEFFMRMIGADCPRICVENPMGLPNTLYRKPDQIIHPYYFGEPFVKRTCLWLKGLPKLKTLENAVKPLPAYSHLRKPSKYYKGTEMKHRYYVDSQSRSSADRSRTFESVAEAMAEQWG